MQKKIWLSLMMLMFVLIVPVMGQTWVLIDQSGDWVICELTHIKRYGWNEGNVTWQCNLTGFNGFTIKSNISDWDTFREWYQWNSWMDYYVRIMIDNGVQKWGVILKTVGWTETFGLAKGVKLYAIAKNNTSSFSDLDWTDWVIILNRAYQNVISIFPEGKVVISVMGNDGSGNKTWGTTYNLYSDFTGQNVTITLNYFHGGQGQFDIYQTLTYSGETQVYEEHPPWGRTFFDDLWETIKVFFGSLGQWFGWLNTFIVFLFKALKMAFPIIPIIVLFWFLDAVGTSIAYGDWHPIGDVFFTLFDFIRGIIQTIVNIAQTIWSIIKWW